MVDSTFSAVIKNEEADSDGERFQLFLLDESTNLSDPLKDDIVDENKHDILLPNAPNAHCSCCPVTTKLQLLKDSFPDGEISLIKMKNERQKPCGMFNKTVQTSAGLITVIDVDAKYDKIVDDKSDEESKDFLGFSPAKDKEGCIKSVHLEIYRAIRKCTLVCPLQSGNMPGKVPKIEATYCLTEKRRQNVAGKARDPALPPTSNKTKRGRRPTAKQAQLQSIKQSKIDKRKKEEALVSSTPINHKNTLQSSYMTSQNSSLQDIVPNKGELGDCGHQMVLPIKRKRGRPPLKTKLTPPINNDIGSEPLVCCSSSVKRRRGRPLGSKSKTSAAAPMTTMVPLYRRNRRRQSLLYVQKVKTIQEAKYDMIVDDESDEESKDFLGFSPAKDKEGCIKSVHLEIYRAIRKCTLVCPLQCGNMPGKVPKIEATYCLTEKRRQNVAGIARDPALPPTSNKTKRGRRPTAKQAQLQSIKQSKIDKRKKKEALVSSTPINHKNTLQSSYMTSQNSSLQDIVPNKGELGDCGHQMVLPIKRKRGRPPLKTKLTPPINNDIGSEPLVCCSSSVKRRRGRPLGSKSKTSAAAPMTTMVPLYRRNRRRVVTSVCSEG